MKRKILVFGIISGLIFLFISFCAATSGQQTNSVDLNSSLVEEYKKVGIDIKKELKKRNLYQEDGQYFIKFREPELKKDVISDLKEYYDTDVKKVSLKDALKMDALLSENKHYKTIDDLKFFLNFKSLYLDNNQIDDYRGLKYLKKLNSLHLKNNNLKDIQFLKFVTSELEYLRLSNNQIKDVAPINHLVNLKSLSLSNNQIQDLTCLSTMKKLRSLRLENNHLKTLKGLKAEYVSLYVEGNPLTVEGLEEIKNLKIYTLVIDREVFDGIVFANYPEFLWDIENLEFIEEDEDESKNR